VIAIVIVVLVGSLNDWQMERQFRAINEKKDDRTVKVIRDGREQQINIKVSSTFSSRYDPVSSISCRTSLSATSPFWNLMKSFLVTVFWSPVTILSRAL